MKALTALWLFGWWYQIQWQYWTWSWPVMILLAVWLIGSIGLYRVVSKILYIWARF